MDGSDSTQARIKIVSDETGGLVSLAAVMRHGQDRAVKVANNFSGLLRSADSQLLYQLTQLLSTRLPSALPGEIIVGMAKSGIIICGMTALARKSRFNWTTPDKLGDYEHAFSFTEGHRAKTHYLHGVKPGDNVIVVEDEVTTGEGLIGLTLALRDFGVDVRAMGCIVENVSLGARQRAKDSTGLNLQSLVRIEVA